MRAFSIRNLYRRGSNRVIGQPLQDWLQEFSLEQGLPDTETFLRIVEHEQRKSLRRSQPVSAIRLSWASSTLCVQSDTGASRRTWSHVLRALRQNSRETDVKFCTPDAILLVLPATSESEAGRAGARLVGSLRSALRELPLSHGRSDWVDSEVVPLSSVLVPTNAPSSTPDSAGRAERDRTPRRDFDGQSERASMDGSFERVAKRTLDLLGATLGIVVLLPLVVLIVGGVKLTSSGPILFSQRRVGLHGRFFTLYKFRTMRSDCNDEIHREYVRKLILGQDHGVNLGSSEQPVFKVKADPRVTRFGRFLRAWSLDELPQLLNVLRGEMSLVGPRPPIPYELESYSPWHFQRLQVKPGITGLWQVKGRSRTTFDEMVRMDVRYIREWSLLLDLKLIIGTLGAVLSRRGAM